MKKNGNQSIFIKTIQRGIEAGFMGLTNYEIG